MDEGKGKLGSSNGEYYITDDMVCLHALSYANDFGIAALQGAVYSRVLLAMSFSTTEALAQANASPVVTQRGAGREFSSCCLATFWSYFMHGFLGAF